MLWAVIGVNRGLLHVDGLNEWVVKDIGSTLYLLLGAVMLLLAIGCGNVSILLLARGTGRLHEYLAAKKRELTPGNAVQSTDLYLRY